MATIRKRGDKYHVQVRRSGQASVTKLKDASITSSRSLATNGIALCDGDVRAALRATTISLSARWRPCELWFRPDRCRALQSAGGAVRPRESEDMTLDEILAGNPRYARCNVSDWHYHLKSQFPNPDRNIIYDAKKNAALAMLADQLAANAEKVIEMNLQHAQDQYGDRNKAENWACVVTLREGLKMLTEVKASVEVA